MSRVYVWGVWALERPQGANGRPGEISMCTCTGTCTDISPLACTAKNAARISAGWKSGSSCGNLVGGWWYRWARGLEACRAKRCSERRFCNSVPDEQPGIVRTAQQNHNARPPELAQGVVASDPLRLQEAPYGSRWVKAWRSVGEKLIIRLSKPELPLEMGGRLPKRRSRRPAGRRTPEGTGIAEVTRVRERFERLLTAGVEIFSEHSLERVLQRVVDAAREVVGARYAALGVLSPDGTSLVQFVTSGITQAERDRIGDLPRGRGLLGLVIREPAPIRTADINRHAQRYGFPPHHPPMRSFLGVPVVARGKVFGNLYLTEKVGVDEFSVEDEAIAVLLAASTAVAVENARLHEASQDLLGQVRIMQRQRDLFFAMMNHELRNALTGVYGWAERLVKGKSAEAIAQAGREVYEGADRTITLLNNFLDLTRLDAGKVRPVWREVDVPNSVHRALTGVRPAAEAKGIALGERSPDAPPTLRTDPVRLEQILVNLLSNAVRHSPEGGIVTVQVEPQPAAVAFRVSDHGPGIPTELQERIFEPFERFDPHSGVGTGLGLPVSRRLAEVLGGRLTVESVVGRGATFSLSLPLAPPST